jgi:putative membrane protein
VNIRTQRILSLSSLFLWVAAASAQTPRPAPTGGNPTDASTAHQAGSNVVGQAVSADTFIKKASQDGLAEVKVAALAQQKSQSQDVKEFAAQMQADHGKANSELQAIAASKHVPIATELDAEHQAMLTELSGKSGPAFDAAYASHMVMAHKKAVALFKAGTQSHDPDIAGFASKTLPTLEHHKGMADEMLSKRKLAAAGAPGVTS